MKEELINKAYEIAKERYAALGLDVEKVMEQLQKVSISMHCWQADDVQGFESAGSLTGGIQTTGNYPGKARNMEELRSDILKAASYIPGKHRLNLHEIYGDFGGTFVDRDQVVIRVCYNICFIFDFFLSSDERYSFSGSSGPRYP